MKGIYLLIIGIILTSSSATGELTISNPVAAVAGSTTTTTTISAPQPCDSCSGCNDKIQAASPGETIYLTQDIAYNSGGICIEFENKVGITFDCQGHNLEGGPEGGYGIYLHYSSNNTIKNCKVSLFSKGIYLHHSPLNNLIHNTASNNQAYGISLSFSDNNVIKNNVANSNAYGMYIPVSSHNEISDNTADSNSVSGIYIPHGCDNVLSQNRFCANTDGDIRSFESECNTGNENLCETTHNWDDEGATGCTYSCVAAASKTGEILELGGIEDARVGKTVTLSARLRNTGDGPMTDTCELWFWMGGGGISERWVGYAGCPTLFPGGDQWYSFNYEMPPDAEGEYELRAQAYYRQDDNYPTLSDQQGPVYFDVVENVISAEITGLEKPSAAIAGKTLTLDAQVRNTGNVMLDEGCEVWFWMGIPAGNGYSWDEWLGFTSCAGLGIGEDALYAFDWNIPLTAARDDYEYRAGVFYKAGDESYSVISDLAGPESLNVAYPTEINDIQRIGDSGGSLKIKVKVGNNGDTRIDGCEVWAIFDDEWTGPADCSDLDGGAQGEYTLETTASEGNHEIRAQIWKDNAYAISEWSGEYEFNVIEAVFSADILDLRDIWYVGAGENIALEAKVENTGNADMDSGCEVWFYVSEYGWLGYTPCDGLVVGASQNYTYGWKVPFDAELKDHNYFASVYLKRNGDYTEISERPATKPIEVGRWAYVVNIGMAREDNLSRNVSLKAHVVNIGNYALGKDCEVWFWVNGTGISDNWFGFDSCGGLYTGISGRYSYDWELPGYALGTYEYWVQVRDIDNEMYYAISDRVGPGYFEVLESPDGGDTPPDGPPE